MITKKLFTLLMLCLSIPLHGTDYQVSLIKSDPNPQITMLLEPVFNKGISHYLQDTFNNPLYALEILPNNFFHLIELIRHGIETNKPKIYFRSVLRLFTNKLKSCSYINAYAFNDVLIELKSLLEKQFIVDASKAFESSKDIINEMLLSNFVAKFPDFKANPGTFLESVSQDLEDAVELRKLLMFFLDTAMSKLVWNPQESDKTWDNVKKVAERLNTMYKRSMISDQDDLNSLYITLIERYSFFLDITGPQLSSTFFQKIKDDITHNKPPFLELAEQEQYLETKNQRMLRVVFEGEAKARAREQGMLI